MKPLGTEEEADSSEDDALAQGEAGSGEVASGEAVSDMSTNTIGRRKRAPQPGKRGKRPKIVGKGVVVIQY